MLSQCDKQGLRNGAIAGVAATAVAGIAVSQASLPWATIKKVALPLGLGLALGGLVYFAKRASCAQPALGLRGLPKGIRCPKVKGVSKAVWKRAIAVELEHTANRETARCIAAAHLEESPRYYTELAKMERSL